MRARASWSEHAYGACLGFLALVCYLAIRPSAFYGDGPRIVFDLANGAVEWQNHVLFLRVLGPVTRWMGCTSLPLFDVLGIVSAAGTAVGVWSAYHVARVWLCDRNAAIRAALLCMVCPAWVLFSGVVEVHGLFMAFAGVALVLLVAGADRGGVLRIAGAGLATGTAQGVHATGALLVAIGWFLIAAFGRRDRRGWGSIARSAGLLLASHVCSLVGIVACVAGSVGLARLGTHDAGPATLSATLAGVNAARVVLWEFLLPFAPLSLTLLVACFRARDRLEHLALLSLVILYLVPTLTMLHGLPEYGAYLLPLEVLVAVWIGGKCGRRLWLCCLAASVIVAAVLRVHVLEPESHAMPRDAVARIGGGGAAEHDGPAILIFTRDGADIIAFVRANPKLVWGEIERFVATQGSLEHARRALDQIVGQQDAGRVQVYLTASGWAAVQSRGDNPTMMGVHEHIVQRYALDPVEGFHGQLFRIQRRR